MSKKMPTPWKRRNIIYYVAVISSIACLVFGIWLVLYAGRISEQETIQYIKDSTEQTRFALDEHIQEEFSILSAAAVMKKERELLADDEHFNRMLQRLFLFNTYELIGISDTAGQTIWVDRQGNRHHENYANEDFIRQALADKTTVSTTRAAPVSGLPVNYYAVPIRENDAVVGVLFAADPEDEMRIIINNSLHAGQGLAHIVDKDGYYVVESDSPLTLGIGNHIFDIEKPLDVQDKVKILEDFAAGRSGYLQRAFSDGSRHVAYAPLTVNDWFVFYVVPTDSVNAGMRFVIDGAVGIIAVSAALFVAFTLLIWQSNAKRRTELENIAFLDPLTRQHNGTRFLIDARNTLKRNPGIRYAVWYCDIHGFKYLNAVFGSSISDKLLQYWADYLAETTTGNEAFGRAHDDVFWILRRYADDEELENQFAQDSAHLAAFPPLASQGYRPDLFAGIFRANPKDKPGTVEEMLDRADTARKAIKRTSGKNFELYTEEMRLQKLWETEMEAHMETALQDGEFDVYWQPKINILKKNKIYGMEALVRWNYPEKGIIPPGKFIPLFEENGFIAKLDRYVLERACRQYEANILPLNESPPLVMSVNVSRPGLFHPNFLKTCIEIRDRYNLPWWCIELEFTESLVFENHARLAKIIAELRHNGFYTSLDDFGAGYSSLNILTTLQVDILKLDRLFFLPEGDTARGHKLVQTIVRLANALEMKTVAEGVDTFETVDLLRQIGCDAVQGYVFSRPLPAQEFMAFLKNWADSEALGLPSA